MTVANRLKFTVAITSAATITPPGSPNVAGYRVLVQSIAAGDVAANTTNVPLTSEDASGNWEESYYTVSADGLSFVRTSVAASSAGGTTPATFSGTVTVYCTMFADYVNKLLTSANTVDAATLTNITPTTSHKVLLIDPNTGLMYTALVSAILALSGAVPAAATAVTLGVSAASSVIGSPVTVTVSTNNPLTGSQTESVTLTAPVAGTWSTNPVTLNATTGTATPTFTPSAAGSGNITASATGTPTLTGGSVAYAATATPAQAITVNNPGPQTANTSYTASGTWSNVKPTTLQFRVTDNAGTPGAWSTPTNIVINDAGTWTFTATPTLSSTSRTMTVQDPATTVSGTSTAYVVNAAAGGTMASLYQLVTGVNQSAITGPQAVGGTSPDLNWGFYPVRLNIKSAGGAVPLAADVQFTFGKKGNPCPTTFGNGTPVGANGNAGVHSNGTQSVSRFGNWTDNTSQYFGTLSADGTLYAWGTPGTYILWVMYRDGSTKAYDNGTGTPIEWVLS